MEDVIDIELLMEMHQSIPRYTSYPTAPMWGAFTASDYENSLQNAQGPFSVYVHIPFCKTMCLYCGCSVVLNRKPENEERYVQYLCKEIELIANKLSTNKVNQLHFGGGTPTQLDERQFDLLFSKLKNSFEIDFSSEVAIEIDPRTIGDGKKLKTLRTLGFNRVSFGVQDTNQKVQEQVRRYQSLELTQSCFYQAKELGFSGINIDLIYGLPFQTRVTFEETVKHVLQMRPDRIALFSYAKIPWLKPHQKAIKEESLPTTSEKFEIYLFARAAFQKAGYVAIGMDHFALSSDDLAKAYEKKQLQRNFQGYTVGKAENMLGFGMTSIGYVSGSYVQNKKELTAYYQALDEREIPVERGKTLTEDDHIRRFVIQRLMCDFILDKNEVEKRFSITFNAYFQKELELLMHFAEKGLLEQYENKIIVGMKGELFIRNIAAVFDVYLNQKMGKENIQYSKSI